MDAAPGGEHCHHQAWNGMEHLRDDTNGRRSVTIKKWLAGGAMLAIAALPAVLTALASNGDIIIGTSASNGDIHIGSLAANGLGPDSALTWHRDPGPPDPPVIKR